MKLDRNNDPAIRDFEDWVRRELYGPNDERPPKAEPAKDAETTKPKDRK